MFGAIDYSYLPWEKTWFIAGLVVAAAAVALAILIVGFWNPGNRTDGERGDIAFGFVCLAVVAVILAIIVPVINREARVNGQEFRAEAHQLREQAARNGYEAADIWVKDSSFTVVLNNCRLDAAYYQDGDEFDTYVVEYQYRSGRWDEHHFEDEEDLIRYDPRCAPVDSESET